MSTTYTFKREPAEKETLAPQARVILGHIKAKGSVDRPTLLGLLDKEVTGGKLKESRQSATKILGFYQSRMAEAGFINIKKAVKEPKAPKEKKTVATAKKEKVAA